MSGYGPLLPIDGPAPLPPRFGLLAAATIIETDDERWANGVEVWPYPPDHVQGHDPCAGGSTGTKVAGQTVTKPKFDAFTAYLAATCNARGIATNDEFRARAVGALAAIEGAAAEQQLASGTWVPTGDNRYLTDANLVLPLGTTATSPENALAVLENAIGVTQRAGVVHCDPATAIAWAARYLIEPQGSTMYTRRGTPVAIGDGYIAAHPIGHSAPSACQGWAFATGPVQIRRSAEVTVYGNLAENLDRTTNVITFRAERNYLVVWDGVLQTGVLVDRNATGC